MAVFKDSSQMCEVLGGVWKQLLDHPEVGKKFKDSELTIKYNVSDPNGVIIVTSEGVFYGEQNIKADVEMSLSADTAHKFWLQQISLPVALAKRLISTKGSMTKVMKVLPLLRPLYNMYPAICDQHGLPR